MTDRWPYHLEIHPEESVEQWSMRGAGAIAGLSGTDAIAAILDFLEGQANDRLHSASQKALAGGDDGALYVQQVAEAKGIRDVAKRLGRIATKTEEPEEVVERRARARLDHRRRASSGVAHAR